MDQSIFIGSTPTQALYLLPKMANRHGLIAGATGTGKTITLQGLAEGFSRLGVPVFMADVKGDLSGMGQPGTATPRIQERITALDLKDFGFKGCPVTFWDVFGEQGHPVRTTISEMGPLLLARLLNLNDTQEGVLTLAFKIADDQGLLLLDLKDLRAMLRFLGDNSKEFTTEYGNVSAASIGAIQRALLTLESQGGEHFFGEPALNLDDLIQTDNGQGVVNILAADKLMTSPKLYATFLLWLLSELFERLPEVGDRDKPKLVFFFDEAHLLFNEAPPVLLEKVEQVVRLIRSKGVGVFFISQNPLDIPDKILGQLGNRIQHALRAFTPRDQKAVRAAAETFRSNAALDVATVITELAVGEALVSLLDEQGRPGIVQRTLLSPPHSQIGPITPQQRQTALQQSLVYGQYEKIQDRESAYETLKARTATANEEDNAAGEAAAPRQQRAAQTSREESRPTSTARPRESVVEAMAKSAARAIGSQVGRQILRGVLGSLMGGRR